MRYSDLLIRRNNSPLYSEQFLNRGIRFVDQYETAVLKYPQPSELVDLESEMHTWGMGDRFFKLAQEHYGSARLWWVIAWFNKTPTEFHLKAGDILVIPKPLETILRLFDIS